jgi:hypothetical protein
MGLALEPKCFAPVMASPQPAVAASASSNSDFIIVGCVVFCVDVALVDVLAPEVAQ